MKKIIIISSLLLIGLWTTPAITSADSPTGPNPVTVTSTVASDSCTGQDCYQVFSGLADALGSKFNTIKNAESLGELLNALIAFGIGLGGVLAVVMIMYEGFLYMKTDNVSAKSLARSRIVNTVAGFVLLLSIYTILRTINPDLLNLMPRVDSADLLNVPNRSTDPDFQKTVEDINTSGIPDSTDYSDKVFIAYLYHQQGAGGAPSILWAAKKGYTEIPETTPFIKGKAGQVNKNMKNNVLLSDMQKVIGTSDVTPSNFLKYWKKKVDATKQNAPDPAVSIANALNKVSQEKQSSDISYSLLKTMCSIESGCKEPVASKCNSYGYCGLFQLSKAVFQKHGTGSDIFNYYANALAGANYAVTNYATYLNQKNSINQ